MPACLTGRGGMRESCLQLQCKQPLNHYAKSGQRVLLLEPGQVGYWKIMGNAE